MKRRIVRATTKPVVADSPEKPDTEEIIQERIDALDDDFDYIISGVEKLSRMGGSNADAAVSILGQLSESLQGFIGQVADNM